MTSSRARLWQPMVQLSPLGSGLYMSPFWPFSLTRCKIGC